MPSRYALSFPRKHDHLIHVEARFDALAGDSAVLRMAAWTPGSYLVRDFARQVEGVEATDAGGRPLAVTKVDKAAWRVTLAGADAIVVRYRVFAHELTVRTSHVDGTHAFVNGAPTYLWLEDRRDAPCEVAVDVPPDWGVVTSLPGGPTTFHAADLDELIDSPLHVHAGLVVDFEAAGRPTQLAVWGRFDDGGVADVAKLVDDIGRIVDAHAKVFGGVPYDRYAFILMLAPGVYGGLEHMSSTALLASSYANGTRKKYEELCELVSHEYFHLWNIKRIRPRALGPFDYTRENYTRSLWVAEGLTSYYDRLTLRRARIQNVKRYLDKLGEEWTSYLAIPGRLKQSLEESSFDAWIKLYKPDENTVNSTVSYYLKGALVCLCMDLEIRRRSGGRRSLDDVLVHLWREYGLAGKGYADADVQREMEKAVDLDLSAIFDRCVRGAGDPDLEGALHSAGLLLRVKAEKDGDDVKPPAGWLGVNTKTDAGRLWVTASLEGGPAERYGVYAGDELVAIDGFRVDEKTLADRMAARRPGDGVRVTVFRRDELHEVHLPLAEKPPTWEIVPADKPSELEKDLLASWLGVD